MGNDTWTGNSWMKGGGTVWTTPAVDPQLGLLYITTSNAAPDLNGSARAGDNLFTASVVALDVNTGAYKRHFQEVHHDLWDYDATQPVHLFTATKNGQQIPALAHANKNGNYFILDRRDGTPIFDVAEVKVRAGPGRPGRMLRPLSPGRPPIL
jgi:alcohol dehydrogenase (cytochrome c)